MRVKKNNVKSQIERVLEEKCCYSCSAKNYGEKKKELYEIRKGKFKTVLCKKCAIELAVSINEFLGKKEKPVKKPCDDCLIRHVCDCQTEYECKHNHYNNYTLKD